VTVYAYPTKSLRGDYVRAGIGIALAGAPFLLGDVPFALAAVLLLLLGLFALYGFVTYTRHRTRVELTDDGLVVTAWRRIAIPWQDLSEIRLSYFASRRERKSKKVEGEGWMQLRLKGPEGTVRIESTCDGFEEMLRPAVAIALEKRLSLSGATAANLESLGISLEPPPRPRVSRRDRESAS
jgi:hypothetical protein